MIPIFDTIKQAEKAGVIDYSPGVLIADVLPGSPASVAELRRGDIVLSLDGRDLMRSEDLIKIISSEPNNHRVHILRNGVSLDVDVLPKNGKIGTHILPRIKPVRYQYGITQSLYHGTREVYDQIGFTLRTFGTIFRIVFSHTATQKEKQEATAGIG